MPVDRFGREFQPRLTFQFQRHDMKYCNGPDCLDDTFGQQRLCRASRGQVNVNKDITTFFSLEEHGLLFVQFNDMALVRLRFCDVFQVELTCGTCFQEVGKLAVGLYILEEGVNLQESCMSRQCIWSDLLRSLN